MPLPDPAHSFGALLREQLRITAFALKREAMLAGGALLLICVFSIGMAIRYDDQLNMDVELLLPTLFVAGLLPFAVWKGDPVFGRAFLWTLPVKRQHAALAKVIAGAIWLMAAMSVTAIALSVVALASGGGIGQHRERWLETAAGLTQIQYHTPAWMWLIPFAAALILYLITSALILALRYPVRTVAAIGVAIAVLVATFVNLAPLGAIAQTGETLRIWLVDGPVGIDWLLSGGEDALSHWRRIGDGRGREWIQVWQAMPMLQGWAIAAGFWLIVSIAGLALALRRHWER